MKQGITEVYRLPMALLLAASIAACGGGSSSGGGDGNGELSLRVTDAPFDNAAGVELTFIEIGIRKAEGGWINIPLGSSTIDVAQLQGSESELLVGDVVVPAGDYTELRLVVDESMSKLIDTLGAEYPLTIPSGGASGLKLKGDFTISDTLPTLLIADIDLRKSIIQAGSNFILRPVGRIVDGRNSGHARGTLNALLLSAPGCSDPDPDTFNAVYVFEGHDVVPDDIDDMDAEPVTTARISYDPLSSGYRYEAGFLPAGEYTISFTCSSDVDTLSASEDLNFFGTENITIQVRDTVFL